LKSLAVPACVCSQAMGCGSSKARDVKSAAGKEEDKPSGLKPIGELKSVKAADIGKDGPMLISKAPLPAAMRGLFWVQSQDESSCLASLGGPSNDGGGCSLGELGKDGKNYSVRVSGDRTWAFADKDVGTLKAAKAVDLIYVFEFDSIEAPTFAQISPKLFGVDPNIPEWLLDFEMSLVPDGHEDYPGSVIWRRKSTILSSAINITPKLGESNAGNYYLVQVLSEDGSPIEPAFGKFVEAMKDPKAGDEPGVVWYHEIAA